MRGAQYRTARGGGNALIRLSSTNEAAPALAKQRSEYSSHGALKGCLFRGLLATAASARISRLHRNCAPKPAALVRVLVTGGAGFIGAQVSRRMLDSGYDVAILDNLSTGELAEVPTGAPLFQTDIRDDAEVERLLRDLRPQVVCHHAAQTSAPLSVDDPDTDVAVNIGGTLNVLRSSAACGVRAFVFASSGGAVYGEVPEGRRASTRTPPAPSTPYGCSKLAAEAYVGSFGARFGFRVHVLRYSNVYGPGQHPRNEGGVVAHFAARALLGEPLVIHSLRPPLQHGCVRDYVFVDDVVEANLRATSGALPPGLLNVSTGKPTSTVALAEALVSMTGSCSTLHAAAPRPADVNYSVLAPSRALRRPRILNAGLAATLSWLRSRPSVLAAAGQLDRA